MVAPFLGAVAGWNNLRSVIRSPLSNTPLARRLGVSPPRSTTRSGEGVEDRRTTCRVTDTATGTGDPPDSISDSRPCPSTEGTQGCQGGPNPERRRVSSPIVRTRGGLREPDGVRTGLCVGVGTPPVPLNLIYVEVGERWGRVGPGNQPDPGVFPRGSSDRPSPAPVSVGSQSGDGTVGTVGRHPRLDTKGVGSRGPQGPQHGSSDTDGSGTPRVWDRPSLSLYSS